MLVKTQTLRVNSEYGIMPFQMFYYYTTDSKLISTMARVDCFRVRFKHNQPRYVLKIESYKNLPKYAKEQIKLEALSCILNYIGCDEKRIYIKLC